jgi:hypothetical protein
MQKIYHIKLNALDLGQLLDGLEVRAEAWERTADHLRTRESPPDFLVEECSDSDEANKIAAHYRLIISEIHRQMEADRE